MAKRGKNTKSKSSKLVDVDLDFGSDAKSGESGAKGKTGKDSSKSTNKLLLDNFIALQEAMIGIGSNLKDLNKKITSLLELFEKAAKNFEQESQTSMAKKMSTIIEQNQTIAKSLILMNKTLKGLPQKTAALAEDDFEVKSSAKTKKSQKEEDFSDESDSGAETSEESSEESESSEGSESSEDDSGFKPEPLPDFNF